MTFQAFCVDKAADFICCDLVVDLFLTISFCCEAKICELREGGASVVLIIINSDMEMMLRTQIVHFVGFNWSMSHAEQNLSRECLSTKPIMEDRIRHF